MRACWENPGFSRTVVGKVCHGDSIEYIAVYASFENGQELSYTTRELPEGYDDFKRKLANFALEYYRDVKGE